MNDYNLNAQAKIRELEAEVEKWKSIALIDPLTGCYNRRGLDTQWAELVSSDRRRASVDMSHYVVYMDLNGLKTLNDKLGHAMGDRVITEFARIIKANIPPSDIFARVGGDEFILIVSPSATFEHQDSTNLVERLRSAVQDAGLSCSFGVAEIDGPHLDYATKSAEQLMYLDKLSYGGGRK